MKPSEVRRHILAEHVTARGMLLSVESLAQQVIAGERNLLGHYRPLRGAADAGERCLTQPPGLWPSAPTDALPAG